MSKSRRWVVRDEVPVRGGRTRKGRPFIGVQVNNGEDYPTVDVFNAGVEKDDDDARRFFTMTLPEMRELRAVLGKAITCASRIHLRIVSRKRRAEKKKGERKRKAR